MPKPIVYPYDVLHELTGAYHTQELYDALYGELPVRLTPFEKLLQEHRRARYTYARPYLAHMEALSEPAYVDELAERFYAKEETR